MINNIALEALKKQPYHGRNAKIDKPIVTITKKESEKTSKTASFNEELKFQFSHHQLKSDKNTLKRKKSKESKVVSPDKIYVNISNKIENLVSILKNISIIGSEKDKRVKYICHISSKDRVTNGSISDK